MKKLSLIILIPLFAGALWALQTWVSRENVPCVALNSGVDEQKNLSPERESITFILNEDPNGERGYYHHAAAYYRLHPVDRTDYVITHLRTLERVRKWLWEDRPVNGLPWGRVNIVVHSNEWIGLAAPIFEGGMRANAERLRTAISSGAFLPLPDSVLDRKTLLRIQGCGLGQNPEMLEVLATAFGGDDPDRPLTQSSVNFLHYSAVPDSMNHWKPQLAQVKPYYLFTHPGENQTAEVLASKFQQKYPSEQINWMAALGQESPSGKERAFHESFWVPVLYTVTYKSKAERPDISTDSLQQDWRFMQADLQFQVLETGIPDEKFDWKVQKVLVPGEGGRRDPAIRALGKCKAWVVLQIAHPGDAVLRCDSVSGYPAYLTTVYPPGEELISQK